MRFTSASLLLASILLLVGGTFLILNLNKSLIYGDTAVEFPDDTAMFQQVFERWDRADLATLNSEIIVPETSIRVQMVEGTASYVDQGVEKKITINKGLDITYGEINEILSTRTITVHSPTAEHHYLALFKYNEVSKNSSVVAITTIDNVETITRAYTNNKKDKGIQIQIYYSAKPGTESIRTKSGDYSQMYRVTSEGNLVIDNSLIKSYDRAP